MSRASTDACTAWRAGRARLRRCVGMPGGTARAGPGSGRPRRALTTRVRAATPGQPGVRAPGGLVVRERTRQEVCCCGTTRRRAARPQKTPGGRRARWRSACRVLCDGRPLATAGARGTAPNPGAMRKPALGRGAPTEVVTSRADVRAPSRYGPQAPPSRMPWRGRVLCGPPSAAPLPPCHPSHRLSSFF